MYRSSCHWEIVNPSLRLRVLLCTYLRCRYHTYIISPLRENQHLFGVCKSYTRVPEMPFSCRLSCYHRESFGILLAPLVHVRAYLRRSSHMYHYLAIDGVPASRARLEIIFASTQDAMLMLDIVLLLRELQNLVCASKSCVQIPNTPCSCINHLLLSRELQGLVGSSVLCVQMRSISFSR